jgi:hypothetical protein
LFAAERTHEEKLVVSFGEGWQFQAFPSRVQGHVRDALLTRPLLVANQTIGQFRFKQPTTLAPNDRASMINAIRSTRVGLVLSTTADRPAPRVSSRSFCCRRDGLRLLRRRSLLIQSRVPAKCVRQKVPLAGSLQADEDYQIHAFRPPT